MQQDVRWMASLRSRLGYVWGPGMIYATGGIAWANTDDTANATTSVVGAGCCTFPATFDTTRTGWVVGAGYEAMLSPRWLQRGEYLRCGFDGVSGTVGPTLTTTPGTCNLFACNARYSFGNFDVNVVRLGLSYKF